MIIDEPTDRQLAILKFIAAKTAGDGFPPTIREIGTELGISSTNGVDDHLVALVRKGLLEQRPKAVARGLKLTARGWRWVDPGGDRCPMCNQTRSAA